MIDTMQDTIEQLQTVCGDLRESLRIIVAEIRSGEKRYTLAHGLIFANGHPDGTKLYVVSPLLEAAVVEAERLVRE